MKLPAIALAGALVLLTLPLLPVQATHFCPASTIETVGLPSSHGARHDGATSLVLTLGEGRVLLREALHAPSITITSHNDAVLPGSLGLGERGVHTWEIHAVDPGVHPVRFEASTYCPSDPRGDPETLVFEYAQWSPITKCRDVVHPGATGLVTDEVRFVVGFGELPSREVGWEYHGGQVVHVDPFMEFVAVAVPSSQLQAFVDRTDEDRNARFCETDAFAEPLFTPDDPLFGSLYGMTVTNADDAWDTTLGTTLRNVCVVDTGLRTTHEDIAGPRYLGGFDVAENDWTISDPDGHGTHVAGTAAATTDNGLGVSGMSQSGILVAKVFLDGGGINWGSWASWVASGITWCAQNGGDVISISLRIIDPMGNPIDSPVVRSAVSEAWDGGRLVVAAAGNGACVDCIEYPAKYPKALAVACTDASDALCGFTSTGDQAGIAAPGKDILSTCASHDAHYCLSSGTSMAAPHVSGAAALVWSHVPWLTNKGVRHVLQCTAADLGLGGWDELHGDGRLDVDAALAAAANGSCAPSCWASITVVGAFVGGVYDGPVDVLVAHGAGAHVVSITATASDGATLTVTPIGHDAWNLFGPDSTTRTITFTADLTCGASMTHSWVQTN